MASEALPWDRTTLLSLSLLSNVCLPSPYTFRDPFSSQKETSKIWPRMNPGMSSGLFHQVIYLLVCVCFCGTALEPRSF